MPSQEGTGLDAPDVETLVDLSEVGVVALSPDGTVVTVNEAFATLAGFSVDEIESAPVTAVFPGHDVATLAADLLDRGTEGPVSTVLPLRRSDGDVLSCELQLRLLSDGSEERGYVGIVRKRDNGAEIAARTETAITQSFRSLAEAIPDGIIVLNTESGILYANPAVESILGHSPSELVGGSKLKIIPPRLRETHLAAIDRYLETGEKHIDWSYVELPGQHADGHEVPLGISLNDFTMDGERYFVGLFRDISAQKAAEREVTERVAQQEAIATLGRRALEATETTALFSDASDIVAELLDAEYCTLLELDEAAETLDLRATTGLPSSLVGTASIPVSERETLGGYTLSVDESVVVADMETETRFDVPARIADRGIRSAISVRIGPEDNPWGVLAVFDDEPEAFVERDVHALESVANVLGSAIDRHERTQQIAAQRERLDAITQVYRVVRDIQQAVLNQNSREDIEQLVCDRLVGLDRISFSWVADLDLAERRFEPTAHAGDEDGYLDEITVTTGDEPTGNGPIGTAAQTGEIQVVSDTETDDSFAPWRDAALERGFRSVVAVPLVYERTVYGVLTVYADEPNVFEAEVQTVFETLGQLLGHAIAAITQQEVLHAETAVEVELQVDGLLEELGIDLTDTAPLHIRRIVPVGDAFVGYGQTTAPPEALEGFEGVDAVDSVEVVETESDELEFQIRWRDAPISRVVTSFGGQLRSVVVDGESVLCTIRLPPSVEVTRLAEELEADYPDVDIVLQRRRVVDADRHEQANEALLDRLTERQLNTLEAAYFSGYFEWPRTVKGGELADAMDVSSPTFHQHLRAAEREIFTELFEPET